MKQIAALAVILFGASTAGAATNPVLDDKFTFKLGAIYNEVDGSVTIARAPLPETPVDIDDVLGIDTNQTSPWAAFRWRFGERWALNAHFDRFDQSGSAEVSDQFNLDGVIYPVGARIDTDFRADAYVMDISYSIWKTSNYEAGVGFGLHAFDLKVDAKASLLVGEEYEEYAASTDDLIAPVPNLRLFGTYAFNEKTSITANGGWLSLSYEDYDGSFYYVDAAVQYQLTNNWGLGLGLQYTDVDVEHDSGNGDFEELNVNFTGVTASVTYSF